MADAGGRGGVKALDMVGRGSVANGISAESRSLAVECSELAALLRDTGDACFSRGGD